MEFGFLEEEERILEEVRRFIKNEEIPPDVLAETHKNEGTYGGKEGRRFIREFAAHGWLTPTWPKQYGGLETTEMVNYRIRDELAYRGLPFKFVAAHMAGPIILRIASEEMKQKYLLPIARGEIEFALGYTEPQAGSDLASITMTAEDKGDYFLVNGGKIFNTSCHMADYHWLIARTDPDAPKKYKGVSLFIVDMKSPGITVSPLITMAGSRVNEVHYDDVKVPKETLVGEKDKGFYYLMAALDFERMFPFGSYRKLFEEIVDYSKTTTLNGKPLSKDPLVRQKIAETATKLEVSKLIYYQLADILDRGKTPNYQSSMEKVFVTEVAQCIARTGMEILGLNGQLKADSKYAPLAGKVEYYYRQCIVETIYAGTSEIMRNIIAERGLGLPRS